MTVFFDLLLLEPEDVEEGKAAFLLDFEDEEEAVAGSGSIAGTAGSSTSTSTSMSTSALRLREVDLTVGGFVVVVVRDLVDLNSERRQSVENALRSIEGS